MPVHWIRYNPDSFRFFGRLFDPDKAKWEALLLGQLRQALDDAANADYEHFITLTYICYNLNFGRRSLLCEEDCTGGVNCMLRIYKFKTIEDYTVWAERRLTVNTKPTNTDH